MKHDVSDVDVALTAAEAGASMIRAAYGGILTTHPKADLDFTTNADLDAERAILEVIAAARPDDGLKGEETGTHGVSGSRRWLVDPLCGTLNFAAQTPLVAVNVALVDGSDDRDMEAVTLACASADPLSGETFLGMPSGRLRPPRRCGQAASPHVPVPARRRQLRRPI